MGLSYVPMDLFMRARSFAEALQALLNDGNPSGEGRPLVSIESTYMGLGFLVDLTGLRFEFPAMSFVMVGSS